MKAKTLSIDTFLLRLLKEGRLDLLTKIRPGRESELRASSNASVFVKNVNDTHLEIRYSVAGSSYQDEFMTLSLKPLSSISTPILARRAGSVSSSAKSISSRANGALGGRPRKKVSSQV